MKYKAGDTVRVKSKNWYNTNKNEYGDINCGGENFVAGMSKYCRKKLVIKEIFGDLYLVNNCWYRFTDDMLEDKNTSLFSRVKNLMKRLLEVFYFPT